MAKTQTSRKVVMKKTSKTTGASNMPKSSSESSKSSKTIAAVAVKTAVVPKALAALYNSLLDFVPEERQEEFLQTFVKNAPKNKTAKKTKDPNKPKGAKSAYILFCADPEIRTRIKEENPGITTTEISKRAGELWKGEYADEELRRKYVEDAEIDKARHKREMENYTPSSDDESGLSGSEKTKRSKKTKDPNKPKGAKSAYILFCADPEIRTRVKEENPGISNVDLTKKIGELWKGEYADEELRRKYVEEAEIDKARHKKEMEEYKNGGGNSGDDSSKLPSFLKKSDEPKPKKVVKKAAKKVTKKADPPPPDQESDAESDDEVSKLINDAMQDDDVEEEEEIEEEEDVVSTECNHTFSSGVRKNKKCGKKVVKDGKCRAHMSDDEDDE